MAIAFFAFFGVVIVAVLRVAEVDGLQQVDTEATALADSRSEAGAALGAADAGRTDLALTCSAGASAQLTMQTGETVGYTVNQCNPGLTGFGTSGPGPGNNCILCVLNLQPSMAPGNVVVTLHCAQCPTDVVTTAGDIYINGDIHSGTSISAQPPGAHIRVLYNPAYAGGVTTNCTCSPAPTAYAPAITDPLASLGAPSPVVGEPTGCTSQNWNPANGCSTNTNGTATLNPGLWSSMSFGGQASITLNPGVYVLTGALSMSGQASIQGSGVTLYLTCPGYGSSGSPCASAGATGGSIDLSGQGTTSLSAPSSGQYSGISVLADPHLLDLGGASKCASGSSNSCALHTGGKGASIGGTVDLRSSGVSLQGNAGDTIGGRLIVNTLEMSVSGNVGSGLSLFGGTGISTSACGVFDDAVSWASGSSGASGRAIIQSQCGSGASSGVVYFNYKS